MVHSLLLALLGVSLLCVASALWLWQRAQSLQQRVSTERFVDSRLAAVGTAATVATGRAAEPVASHGLLHRLTIRILGPAYERLARAAHRAGVRDIARFYVLALLAVGAIAVYVWLQTNLIVCAIAVVVALTGLCLWLWQRASRLQRRIVAQLPAFLDGVVRMITIGNSVAAAFQAAVPATDYPLRDALERASRMMRAGLEVDKALTNLSELYQVEEFMLIASVIRLSVRYGGRADLVLERISAFMRDREMAQRELHALSAETRLSAWILGLLPVVLGLFIVIRNPSYFSHMWFDPSGRHLFQAAVGLQMLGAFLLYRLARL